MSARTIRSTSRTGGRRTRFCSNRLSGQCHSAGSGRDAFAEYGSGELNGVLGDQLEFTAASITGHVLVSVIFRLDMNDCGAMRAFAFVLAAVIPLVIVALGDLGQSLGFHNCVFGVLTRLACKTFRMTPWNFSQLRAVSAA